MRTKPSNSPTKTLASPPWPTHCRVRCSLTQPHAAHHTSGSNLPARLLAAALLPRCALRAPALHAATLAPLTTLTATLPADTTLANYLNHMAPWALHTVPTALAATLTASLAASQSTSLSAPQAAALNAVLQCMGATGGPDEQPAIPDKDAVAMVHAAPHPVVMACLHAACRDGDAVSTGGQRMLSLLLEPSDQQGQPLPLLQLVQSVPALHAALTSALHKASGPAVAPLLQRIKDLLPPLPALAPTPSQQWSPLRQQPSEAPSMYVIVRRQSIAMHLVSHMHTMSLAWGAKRETTPHCVQHHVPAHSAGRRSRFDVEPEEGEALPPPSSRPSRDPSAADLDSITRVAPASRCVWLRGVPRRLSNADIGDECARHASVAAVLPGLEPDEAVVVFSTIRCVRWCELQRAESFKYMHHDHRHVLLDTLLSHRHAVRGYEAMLGSCPWGIWQPLDAGFCADEPRGAPRPPRDVPPDCGVWVAGCRDAATEAAVMGLLRDARRVPEEVLRVKGQGPGVMALYSHPRTVCCVVC